MIEVAVIWSSLLRIISDQLWSKFFALDHIILVVIHFFALDHIILVVTYFFCAGSYETSSDPKYFALDHIILVVIIFFCSGSYHTSSNPIYFCSGSYNSSGDPIFFCSGSYHTSGDPIFLLWIMIIFISMIWPFWSKSNDRWSSAPTPDHNWSSCYILSSHSEPSFGSLKEKKFHE